MSTISELIGLIRTATLGKDVRNSIAESLESINGRQDNYETDFDAIKEAYDAATKANINLELSNARHDNVNNVDYETVGARLDSYSSALVDIMTLNSHTITYTYNSDGTISGSVEKDSNNNTIKTVIYTYTDGVVTSSVTTMNGKTLTTTYGYDTNGNVTSVTNVLS